MSHYREWGGDTLITAPSMLHPTTHFKCTHCLFSPWPSFCYRKPSSLSNWLLTLVEFCSTGSRNNPFSLRFVLIWVSVSGRWFVSLRSKILFLAVHVLFLPKRHLRGSTRKMSVSQIRVEFLNSTKKLSMCLEASVTQVNGPFDACCVYRSSPKETWITTKVSVVRRGMLTNYSLNLFAV